MRVLLVCVATLGALCASAQAEVPCRMPIADLGPLQVYLRGPSAPPANRDALLGALATAVRHWKVGGHDGGIGGRGYWCGEAALK